MKVFLFYRCIQVKKHEASGFKGASTYWLAALKRSQNTDLIKV